jgi:hypothetical protein
MHFPPAHSPHLLSMQPAKQYLYRDLSGECSILTPGPLGRGEFH